jgi:hypothetical protein
MLSQDQVDRLLCQLATWELDTLLAQLAAYRSDFPVDLSADFLGGQTVDRVRHIFFALCVQNRRLPESLTERAAAA